MPEAAATMLRKVNMARHLREREREERGEKKGGKKGQKCRKIQK